jgi:hypothetical protein
MYSFSPALGFLMALLFVALDGNLEAILGTLSLSSLIYMHFVPSYRGAAINDNVLTRDRSTQC